MKKFGARVILSLILALTFLIVPFGNAAAAPSEKSWIHITDFSEDHITFDFGWNHVGVYAYRLYVTENPPPTWYLNSGIVYMDGGTTRSFVSDPVEVDSAGIDLSDNDVYVRLWCYDKHLKIIKRASIDLQSNVDFYPTI